MSNPLEELLSATAPEAAPALLGAVLVRSDPQATVALRLSEVEAYGGPAESDLPDPGAHTFRGRTARNASMFGPPAHLYVYFTYGLHHALNLVCRPDEQAGGCLIRSGEVVVGEDTARRRRSAHRATEPTHRALARGPGNVAQALALDRSDDGAALRYLGSSPDPVLAAQRLAAENPGYPKPWTGLFLPDRAGQLEIMTTARTGVSGVGGTDAFPWRFALHHDPTVSPYRKAAVKKRRTRS